MHESRARFAHIHPRIKFADRHNYKIYTHAYTESKNRDHKRTNQIAQTLIDI